LDRITGPLGFWNFPLLNCLLAIAEAVGAGTPSGYSSGSSAENLEEIVWTDWRGRERTMTIHREAREA